MRCEKMEQRGVFEMFAQKPATALMVLLNSDDGMNLSSLAYETNCTIPYLCLIVHRLNTFGILETKKIKNKKIITLSSRGRDAAMHLINLKNKLEVSA